MDIIDLFTILPLKKEIKNNHSKDIYYVMTSGTRGQATVNRAEKVDKTSRVLDLLWIKLEERFKTIGAAFRYFDTDFDNHVSFSEF